MNARRTYAPSGRANLPDLWPHAVLLVAVAGLLAVVYAMLTGANAYAVGWVLVVPAILKTWLCHKTIRNSHCRNAPLAATLLGAAGLAVFLGSYHVDQCLRWGVGWHRLDRLPGYVTFRMETDAWRQLDTLMPLVWPLQANPRVVPHRVPRVQPNLHWGILALDFAVTVVWPAFAAWTFARRPYSETLRAWYREEAVVLTPESAAELRLALSDETLSDWSDLHFERSVPPRPDHPRLRVWVCPRPSDRPEVEPEIYLTLGRAKPGLLTPEEVAALAGVFPSLADWAEVPAELRPADLTQTPPPWNPALATFSRVPPPHAGRCKDPSARRRMRLIVELVTWWPMLFVIAALATTWPAEKALNGFGAPHLIVPYVIGLGIVLMALHRVYYNNPNEDPTLKFVIRYNHSSLLRQARQRGDTLFGVDNPGVMSVELLPRRIWYDTDIAARSDEIVGALLFIDADARRVLFEGDRYRWVVPFAAIRGYEVEVALVDPEFHAVVLSFDTADGLRELPLVATAGLPGADRFERAAALYQMLGEALGESAASAPGVSPPTAPAGRDSGR